MQVWGRICKPHGELAALIHFSSRKSLLHISSTEEGQEKRELCCAANTVHITEAFLSCSLEWIPYQGGK